MGNQPFNFAPATPDRLADLEAIFGESGYARKCWCAYWYLPNAAFKAGWGEGNRTFFRSRVSAGLTPGILAYCGDDPAGWCGLAPRRVFDRLNRSTSFAPVDELPVWAINCFVVRKGYRRRGLLRLLLRNAVKFAREQGAQTLEGYPVDSAGRRSSSDLYPGTLSAFREEGFTEVARRLPGRPIMRLDLSSERNPS
jgi:GNAT superfamily N-acetyltransferase